MAIFFHAGNHTITYSSLHTVENTRCVGVVDKDGVHLTSKANRNAALLICDRMLMLKLEGVKVDGGELTSGVVKRARW
jgi:hypothetical protein